MIKCPNPECKMTLMGGLSLPTCPKCGSSFTEEYPSESVTRRMELHDVNFIEELDKFVSGRLDDMVLKFFIVNAMNKKCNHNDTLTSDEIDWLRWNYDKIPRLINSEVCSAIYFYLYRHGGDCGEDVGKALGKYRRVTMWWVERLSLIDLIKKKKPEPGWGRAAGLFINKTELPTLSQYVFSKMVVFHGEDKLKTLTTKNINVQEEARKKYLAAWK